MPRRRPRPRSATALCPPGDSGASSAHLTGPHSRSGCAGPAPLPGGGPSFPGPRVPRAHALSEAWLRVLCAHRGSALSPGEGGVRPRDSRCTALTSVSRVYAEGTLAARAPYRLPSRFVTDLRFGHICFASKPVPFYCLVFFCCKGCFLNSLGDFLPAQGWGVG